MSLPLYSANGPLSAGLFCSPPECDHASLSGDSETAARSSTKRRTTSLNPRNEELNRSCLGWIGGIASREVASLESLYAATLPYLWSLARKIVGNVDDIEDVLSEVYHQVWRDASRFDPKRSPPMAWLTVICRSRAIDHLRRRESAYSYEDLEGLPGIDPPSTVPEQFEPSQDAGATDPEHAMGWLQECRGLESALATLPATERQLILLAYFKDMSQSELAEALDMPLGTVKSRTRRALAELRRLLEVGVE